MHCTEKYHSVYSQGQMIKEDEDLIETPVSIMVISICVTLVFSFRLNEQASALFKIMFRTKT